ncbi:metallophosphoesterase family protein [Alkalilacustris brevis]|uniref:metallophosphoesterase family protein n=1 Tax=Alkalilacustris brevis TaxID=2026338 RepID=UPI000E0D573C|nr:DNA repair exonuclease [Alkalilacustris brevis]
MIRILHTADVHLDAPLRSLALRDEDLRATVEAATRAAFMRIIDIALSESVAALLIAGDLFDGKERSARTAAFLTGQLDRLRAADIRVFYIKGNHDAENPITGTLDLPDNVHVFDARGGKVQLAEDIWVHGVSFTDRHAPESLLPRFSAPVGGAVNIAMLHTSLAGAAGHDIYAPCSLGDLLGMGFDYWALGHVHKRKVHAKAPWVVMPGMPQGRDIGEVGPRSASLLSIADGNIHVEEVPSSVVEFSTSSLDITSTEGDDALRALLRDHLRATAEALTAAAGVLRLTLRGAPERHWHILRDRDYWSAQIAELARETGNLWLDKVIFNLDAPAVADGTASATNELSALIAAIRGEPGFASAARAEVDEMILDLPPAIRARLLPDQATAEELTRRLAEAGAQRVLARMKGSES